MPAQTPHGHGVLEASRYPPHHPLLEVIGADRGASRPLAGYVLIALAVVALGALGWHATIPERAGQPEDVTVKLAAADCLRNEVDIVFFGSSLVYRHLDPAVIDARLAERGHPLHCYNAALPGSYGLETKMLVRRFLAGGAGRVRWLLVELREHDPRASDAARQTQRFSYWHEADATALALRATWNWELALDRRLELTGLHLQHAFIREARVGKGPDAIRDALGVGDEPLRALVDESVATRGYLPLDEDVAETADGSARRQRFARGLGDFVQRRDSLVAGTLPGDPGAWVDADTIRGQVSDLRAAGVEPVYYIAPVVENFPLLDALAADGSVPHLLAYNRPAAHPELFDPALRFDDDHLAPRGAALLSRLVADDLADLLEAPRR
jgi:hypothetical protein